MEKENKKKATPEINEELMMNLMVDGIKKEGLKLPPEPFEEPQKEKLTKGKACNQRKEQSEKNKRN